MKQSVVTPIAPFSLLVCLACSGPNALGQVVINEIFYDDASTDDREFVELYNAGASPVDIGGWVLGAYDPTTTNPSVTIPAGTLLNPGEFYVIGNAGVLFVGTEVAINFLENDNEVSTLRDAGGVLVDAVAYETNKGAGFITTGATAPADAAQVAAQTGPGIFGNHSGLDLAGTPLNSNVSWGRFVDGRDTNNNGRDFGLRPSTPGTTNAPGGTMSVLALPDPAPQPPGSVLATMTGNFVPVRVIDPAVVDGVNPNAIPAPFAPGSKAYITWDTAGGGNTVTTSAVFPGLAAGFALKVYLDTTNLPVQSNGVGTPFRGSEVTIYSLGGGDASTGTTALTDLDGSVGLSPVALPASESLNGTTGIAWVYERVAADPTTLAVSEKLHLVDANDGGDSDAGGNTPLDWVILATYDLSSTPSGWYDLSIAIDTAGNGTASFNGQTTAFSASAMHSSAFNVFYRENLQMGADGTPDAMLRPPTFTIPSTTPAPLADLTFTTHTPGSINMSIAVAPGQIIGIQYSNTLATGSWLDIGSVTVAGNTGTFSDTDAARLAAGRGFYRAFLRSLAAE